MTQDDLKFKSWISQNQIYPNQWTGQNQTQILFARVKSSICIHINKCELIQFLWYKCVHTVPQMRTRTACVNFPTTHTRKSRHTLWPLSVNLCSFFPEEHIYVIIWYYRESNRKWRYSSYFLLFMKLNDLQTKLNYSFCETRFYKIGEILSDIW